MANNKIAFAGEINAKTVKLFGTSGVAMDILPQMKTLEVFESIFSPFIEAKILVEDSVDLFNNVPLIGEEFLQINMYTPGISDPSGQLDLSLHAYKITDRIKTGDRTTAFMLHCCSTEGFINSNRKISRSFKGSVDEIAKLIITDTKFGLSSKKRHIVEETSNETQYISNYWSPLKNLKYLTWQATNIHGSPTYVFFENRNGFNFVTLDKLYQSPVTEEFLQDNNAEREANEAYKRVLEIETDVIYDYYEKATDGAYASELSVYDIFEKTFKSTEYYPDNDNSLVKLNAVYPYTQGLLRSAYTSKYEMIKHTNMYDNNVDSSNDELYQSRMSAINMANYHNIKIKVPGRTDYTAGQTVMLKVPRGATIRKSDSNDQAIDPILSGKYLIAELNHTITGTQHTTTMGLIKNSMELVK